MDRERLREYLAARLPAAGDIVVGRLERTGGGAGQHRRGATRPIVRIGGDARS